MGSPLRTHSGDGIRVHSTYPPDCTWSRARDFIILLDNDQGGRDARKHYLQTFGETRVDRIIDVSDLSGSQNSTDLASLLSEDDSLKFACVSPTLMQGAYTKRLWSLVLHTRWRQVLTSICLTRAPAGLRGSRRCSHHASPPSKPGQILDRRGARVRRLPEDSRLGRSRSAPPLRGWYSSEHRLEIHYVNSDDPAPAAKAVSSSASMRRRRVWTPMPRHVGGRGQRDDGAGLAGSMTDMVSRLCVVAFRSRWMGPWVPVAELGRCSSSGRRRRGGVTVFDTPCSGAGGHPGRHRRC